MRLAVASGKGGVGKTTVAVAMAEALATARGGATLVDLDVEEPNAHLLLAPRWQETYTEYMPVPIVDEARCTRCGICGEFCQFSAIAVLGDVIVTYEPMCHGCGGCWRLCPEGAIAQGKRELGEVIVGEAGDIEGLRLVMGRLRVGEALAPPLIKRVMKRVEGQGPAVLDAPPGVSCPVMVVASLADGLVLVAEPTPFGLYDLGLALEAFADTGKPMAVVVNRSGLGLEERLERMCEERGVEILLRLPFSRQVAEAYSRGERLGQVWEWVGERLLEVWAWFEQRLAPSVDQAPLEE